MADCETEDRAAPIEARLQVPSSEWLKVKFANCKQTGILCVHVIPQVHSLSAQNLSLDQILPWLGFKQKEGRFGLDVTSMHYHY